MRIIQDHIAHSVVSRYLMEGKLKSDKLGFVARLIDRILKDSAEHLSIIISERLKENQESFPGQDPDFYKREIISDIQRDLSKICELTFDDYQENYIQLKRLIRRSATQQFSKPY